MLQVLKTKFKRSSLVEHVYVTLVVSCLRTVALNTLSKMCAALNALAMMHAALNALGPLHRTLLELN